MGRVFTSSPTAQGSEQTAGTKGSEGPSGAQLGPTRRRFLALAGALAGGAAVSVLAACGGAVTTSATTSSVATTATAAASVSTAAATPAAATSAAASTAVTTSSAPAVTTTAASSSAATAAPAAAAPAAATINLSFWANGGSGDPSYAAWVQRIADFNKANPKVNAVMEAPAGLDAKLVTAVAGGTPPSTAVQDRYTIAAGSAKGLMQDISAMANQAGIKGTDQQPWCWQEVAIKGKLYGLPYSTDARMIYMNVSQAGVDTTAPKTLEDFAVVGQKLTQKQGGALQRLGFIPWNDNWAPWGWGWLFGGDFYDAANNKPTLNDPKVAVGFDWAGTVASQLGYQAVQDFITAHKGNLFTTQVQSSYITSTSFLITVMGAGSSLSWTAWAPPPPQGVAQTSTWSGGFCDVLPAGAKNPDQSFALMNYLTDVTMQTIQNKSGRLPTIIAAAADPYWSTVDPRVKAFINMLPYSHSRPVTPQVNIINTQLNVALTAVLSGKQTATQALKTANDFVITAIQQNLV